MLHAAGLTQRDPALASLFRVTRVSPLVMEQLSEVIAVHPLPGLSTESASYELLAGIAQRNKKLFYTGFGKLVTLVTRQGERYGAEA